MLKLIETERFVDRRSKTRYPIECGLEYRVLRGRGPSSIGKGQTINISSEGLLFYTRDRLSTGIGVELNLEWPVTLDDRIPLTLRIKGSIVRTEGDRAVAQIDSHEFRLGPRRIVNEVTMMRKSSA